MQIAANLIHVMCVQLGIFGFLFLCNLDGYCLPFYRLNHLSKVAKYILKIAKFVARCFWKNTLLG